MTLHVEAAQCGPDDRRAGEPERYPTGFANAGADHLLVQAEPSATIHLRRVLPQIHGLGKTGVVLDPAGGAKHLRHVDQFRFVGSGNLAGGVTAMRALPCIREREGGAAELMATTRNGFRSLDGLIDSLDQSLDFTDADSSAHPRAQHRKYDGAAAVGLTREELCVFLEPYVSRELRAEWRRWGLTTDTHQIESRDLISGERAINYFA